MKMASATQRNRSKRRSGDACSAISCHNARYKKECDGISFFRFPSDESRCRVWVQNSRRDDLRGRPAKELHKHGYFLCSYHFEANQFTVPQERKRLNWNAVPTLFDVPNPPPKLTLTRPGRKERNCAEPPRKKKKLYIQTGCVSPPDWKLALCERMESDYTVRISDVKVEVDVAEEDNTWFTKPSVPRLEREDKHHLYHLGDPDSHHAFAHLGNSGTGGHCLSSTEPDSFAGKWHPNVKVELDDSATAEVPHGRGFNTDSRIKPDPDIKHEPSSPLSPKPDCDVRPELSVLGELNMPSDKQNKPHVIKTESGALTSAGKHDNPSDNTGRSHTPLSSVSSASSCTSDCPVYFQSNEVACKTETSLTNTQSDLKLSNESENKSDASSKPSSDLKLNSNSNRYIIQVGEPGKLREQMDHQTGSRRTSTIAASPSLIEHMRTPTDEKMYKCEVCALAFTTSHRLKVHMRKHTGERPYQCGVCGASFSQNGSLTQHMYTHTGEKPYRCDVCKAGFTTSGSLQLHKRTHTGERPFQCGMCGASFGRSSTLKQHMITHTGEKPYRCEVCEATFTSSAGLKGHLRTHTGEKPYQCTMCGASFAHSSTLRQHTFTHTGEKAYKCSECPAAFSASNTLKVHLRTHTGEKPFRCDVCGASFSQRSNLRQHSFTHTGEKNLYKRSASSVKSVHARTGKKSRKCEASSSQSDNVNKDTSNCAKEKTNKNPASASAVAQVIQDTARKVHKCKECEGAFSTSTKLKIHMRTHTGEKPYQCRECEASFSQSSTLKQHTLTHTGEKPFQCKQCDKTFAASKTLRNHLREKNCLNVKSVEFRLGREAVYSGT